MSDQPRTPVVCKVGGATPKNYDVVVSQGGAEIRLTRRQAQYVASQLLQVAPIQEPEGEE